jgi:hypothetical protein
VAGIRLDSFIDVLGVPVDRKLYVVLTTDDVFAAGSWTRTAATLQGFPGSGSWTLNYATDPGIRVQDAAGNNICTLLAWNGCRGGRRITPRDVHRTQTQPCQRGRVHIRMSMRRTAEPSPWGRRTGELAPPCRAKGVASSI